MSEVSLKRLYSMLVRTGHATVIKIIQYMYSLSSRCADHNLYSMRVRAYRGTSLLRNSDPLDNKSRTMPMALLWS